MALAQVADLERRELQRNAELRRRLAQLAAAGPVTPQPVPAVVWAPVSPPSPPRQPSPSEGELERLASGHTASLRLMHDMFAQQQQLLQRLVDAAIPQPAPTPTAAPAPAPSA
eukprot:Hpha_TRINITY_DN35210_c0_g1::TRINITY_DN35210_c0_g1_i1::g.145209::m.145209